MSKNHLLNPYEVRHSFSLTKDQFALKVIIGEGHVPAEAEIDLWNLSEKTIYLNEWINCCANKKEGWEVCSLPLLDAINHLQRYRYALTDTRKTITVFLEKEVGKPIQILRAEYQGKDKEPSLKILKYNPGEVLEFGAGILVCKKSKKK